MPSKILIIEDNPTNTELMVYLLTAFGYELETACDGKEGLEMALRQLPDLIICDLEMPGMNGYGVAARLRSSLGLPRPPLVAVTAYAMVGDRDRVLAAGFDGYLSKPISPETFVKQIENFLPVEKRSGQTPTTFQAAPAPVSSRQSKRITILFAGNSHVHQSLLRSTLEPSGYRVLAVETAREAIEEAGRDSFDLIVSDLHMPGESGLGFLQSVKADPKLRLIPFILFTASSSQNGGGQRERALELGAAKFVTWPINGEVLLFLIDEVLQGPSKE
jgi:two-component system cell cycle response regulator